MHNHDSNNTTKLEPRHRGRRDHPAAQTCRQVTHGTRYASSHVAHPRDNETVQASKQASMHAGGAVKRLLTDVIICRPLCDATQSAVVFRPSAALLNSFFLWMRDVVAGAAFVTPAKVTLSLRIKQRDMCCGEQNQQRK